MKYLIILTMFLVGCKSDKEYSNDLKTLCFAEGGVGFESGTSGGSSHHVCVYKK